MEMSGSGHVGVMGAAMDEPGYLTMSAKELNRLEVLRRVSWSGV